MLDFLHLLKVDVRLALQRQSGLRAVAANAVASGQNNIPPKLDENSPFFPGGLRAEKGRLEQVFPIYAIKHHVVSIGI